MAAMPGTTHAPRDGFEPAYLRLLASGELDERARSASRRLRSCDLCGRRCGVDRIESPRAAACLTGERARVHAAFAHLGEEPCITGSAGSGTIFFSSCNLRCVYCQNADVAWEREGRDVGAEELAAMMLSVQRMGCHNVNLVSPSHVVAQLLAALPIAARGGLRLPLVYNTGGYDSPEALALLDGVVDMYMPDAKYADSDVGHRFSHVREYASVNRAALREMHRQVGELVLDGEGVARRGLLVRHLVLPNGLAGTEEVLRFIAEELSPDTWVNLMDQYRPCFRSSEHAELARRPTSAELRAAREVADRVGLRRLDPGAAS
jgi:putative pyruvate formate lyase activating enzyme